MPQIIAVVPTSLKERFQAQARTWSVSDSSLARRAITEFLDREAAWDVPLPHPSAKPSSAELSDFENEGGHVGN